MSGVNHIGLIPDGGRRWARKMGVSLDEAYMISLKKCTEYVSSFFEYGVSNISVYMLSKKNLQRSKIDLDAVVQAESIFLETSVRQLTEKYYLNVVIAGDQNLLPGPLSNAAARSAIKENSRSRTLSLCLAYDPFDELAMALSAAQNFYNGGSILKCLWVTEPLDLIIRSGGAMCLSDFLPIQSSYAQLIFLDKLFNDTTLREYKHIVEKQEKQNLLFGI